MDDKGNPVKDGRSEEKWSWSGPQAIGLFVFTFVCIGGYLLWLGREGKDVGRRNDVELNFTHAPDTIPVSVPSRFVLKVNGPERKPLAERSVHVIITPRTKAEILSMTGPSGRASASDSLSSSAEGTSIQVYVR